MDRTKIEWADATFNPWIGCTRVSAGCDNCYAERMAARYQWTQWGPSGTRKPTSAGYWRKPLAWNRQAEREGTRRKVFCASLADVFDAGAPDELRERLWKLAKQTPYIDWLMLTKRPHNIRRMLPEDWGRGYTNVWLGISAEGNASAVHRWPVLSRIPATVRFISYEPALERLLPLPETSGILPDWVIAGGETGPGSRESNPEWFREVRDQCEEWNTAFFMKQMKDRGPIPADLAGARAWPKVSTENAV